MKKILKSKKTFLFVGGILGGTLALKALKNEKTKKFCMNVLENGKKMTKGEHTSFQIDVD